MSSSYYQPAPHPSQQVPVVASCLPKSITRRMLTCTRVCHVMLHPCNVTNIEISFYWLQLHHQLPAKLGANYHHYYSCKYTHLQISTTYITELHCSGGFFKAGKGVVLVSCCICREVIEESSRAQDGPEGDVKAARQFTIALQQGEGD